MVHITDYNNTRILGVIMKKNNPTIEIGLNHDNHTVESNSRTSVLHSSQNMV